MLHDIVVAFENNFFLFLMGHILISLIIALFSNRYSAKRFIVDSEEAKKKDIAKLEGVQYESRTFKFFFKVSLHKNNNITYMTFIFLFNFVMPLLGPFLSIWIIYFLKNVKYGKKVMHTGILDLSEFKFTFGKVERIFGEGSMTDMMNNPYAPKSKKIKALSSLASSKTPANLKIIRETLSSTDDEIRMYGYGVINKAEQALSAKINDHLEVYLEETEASDEQRDEEAMAFAAKELAFLYWEMVYTELAHDSLKDNFLNETTNYIEVAKKFYSAKMDNFDHWIEEVEQKIAKLNPKKKKEKPLIEEYKQEIEKIVETEKHTKEIVAKLYLLMGRVYMKRDKGLEASEEFKVAHQLDNSAFIIPYLAESHFLAGEYEVVKQIMNSAKDLEYNPSLYPIVEQWREI